MNTIIPIYTINFHWTADICCHSSALWIFYLVELSLIRSFLTKIACSLWWFVLAMEHSCGLHAPDTCPSSSHPSYRRPSHIPRVLRQPLSYHTHVYAFRGNYAELGHGCVGWLKHNFTSETGNLLVMCLSSMICRASEVSVARPANGFHPPCVVFGPIRRCRLRVIGGLRWRCIC